MGALRRDQTNTVSATLPTVHDRGISVLNHCLECISSFNTHVSHSKQLFNIHLHVHISDTTHNTQPLYGRFPVLRQLAVDLLWDASSTYSNSLHPKLLVGSCSFFVKFLTGPRLSLLFISFWGHSIVLYSTLSANDAFLGLTLYSRSDSNSSSIVQHSNNQQ